MNNIKSILVADLHLHHLPIWRFDWCEKFIYKIIEDECNGNADLFLLGDVFEVKDKIDSRVVNLFLDFVCMWSDKSSVVWITGQHDSYLPQKASLEKLKISNLTIVDRDVCQYKDSVYFAPFARQVDLYRQWLDKVPDNAVLLTHMPVKEIIEQYGGKDPNGISVDEFSRFKDVFSGDIHAYQDMKNLHYVGAPSQRDWRDKATKGCYGKLSINDDAISFDRKFVDHPIHLEIEDDSDVEKIDPDKEYILRMPRGIDIDNKDNILSIMYNDIDKIKAVKVDSLSDISTDNIMDKVKKYNKEHAYSSDIDDNKKALDAGLMLLD